MPQPPSDRTLWVDAPADEVLERLSRGLVPMRHLWFTSPADLRRWDRATVPLYLRRLGPRQVEVGPRLANLQAARLCPVVRVALTEEQGRTHLSWSTPRLPAFARGLLWVVAVGCAAWGGVIASAWMTDGPAARGWVFWLGLSGVVPTVLALAWGPGRTALDDALDLLPRVAQDEGAGADDW